MQSAPSLDFNAILDDVNKIQGVNDIHHLHAWMINEHQIVFSAHVDYQNMSLTDMGKISQQIENLLKDKYQISHVTLQAECQPNCSNSQQLQV